MTDLKDLRKEINIIDKEIASLFEKRMELVKGVAEYKIEHAMPILDSDREKQVIEANLSNIKNEELKEYYVTFLKDLMGISKEYQRRITSGMNIAYSGVEGAFSHLAARKLFNQSNLISYPSFDKAYKAVEDGLVDACVLPIENSHAGDVGLVMDLVFSGSLYINNIIDVDIVHNLLCKPGAKLEDIKVVKSHPQALAQCNDYIVKHGFKTQDAVNTAIASKELAESIDFDTAVIASIETAELYGLNVLETNINNARNNTTRFALFSRVHNKVESTNKMGKHSILVFTVLNEAGALANALNIIGSHGYNMRNLRSRPMKELMWQYYFYVEIEGDISTQDGKDMLVELRSICDRLKVVGSYYQFAEK